jgi:hypothetical protein
MVIKKPLVETNGLSIRILSLCYGKLTLAN